MAAMLIFALYACTDEVSEGKAVSEDNDYLCYAVLDNFIDVNRADGTRAITRTTIDSLSTWDNMFDREITLYLDGVMYDNYFVSSTGKISAAFGPFFYNAISAFTDVRGWRPTTGVDSLKYFTVRRDQSKFRYIEASDLCYGTLQPDNKIHFYHKMAQIEIHCKAKLSLVTKDTSFVYNVPLDWLKIGGACLGGTFDMGNPYYTSNPATNGIVARKGTEDTVTCYLFNRTTESNGDTSYTYKGIIFPQDTSIEFIARAMDSTFAGSVEKHEYKAGYLYNAYFTIRPRYELSFGSATWNVGDYLCANEYGKLYAFSKADLPKAVAWNILPIGIIFNVGTTKRDSAMGWTHGYAMALEDAATGVQWGTNYGYNVVDTMHRYHTWDSARLDLDGYHATMQVVNRSNYSEDNFPAFYYTRNYKAAHRVWSLKYISSGWYIPTNGQWGLILQKLGMQAEPLLNQTPPENYITNASNVARNNINEYIRGVDGYVKYDLIPDNTTMEIDYWCSSESDINIGNANAVRFFASASSAGSYALTYIGGVTKGSTLGSGYIYNTRPVIAF